MSGTTKLHTMLSNVAEPKMEQRYELADYLAAHCSVDELARVCGLTAQPFAVRPTTGRIDKAQTAEALLVEAEIDAPTLLAACDVVLAERAVSRRERAAALSRVDEPAIDDGLAQTLTLLCAEEIAALYLGLSQRHHVLYTQLHEHYARKTAHQLSLNRDLRARLEYGFRWLLLHNPEKLRRITDELRLGADEWTTSQIAYLERDLAHGGKALVDAAIA